MFNHKFNCKYYSVDQEKDIYYKICSIFLRAINDTKNDKNIKIMEEILYDGTYGNYTINTNLANKKNARLEMKKRAALAYVLATTPETFNIFANKNINLFHGTNITALPGILESGLKSFAELSKTGEIVITGEEWSRNYTKPRTFISLTDDCGIAVDYAINSSSTTQKDNSFGMIIGLSSDNVNKMRYRLIDSDIPEIGIKDTIPLEYIKVIAVPEEKVKFIQKLVHDKSITVVPIDLDDKFYYIDDLAFLIDDTKAEEFIEKIHNNSQNKAHTFNLEDLKNLAQGRNISKIRKIYNDFISKIRIHRNGKDKGNDSR